jgi:hypothetical protein
VIFPNLTPGLLARRLFFSLCRCTDSAVHKKILLNRKRVPIIGFASGAFVRFGVVSSILLLKVELGAIATGLRFFLPVSTSLFSMPISSCLTMV